MEAAESILSALSQPVLVLDGALQPLIASPAFCGMPGLNAKRASRRVIDGLVSGNVCGSALCEIPAPVVGGGASMKEESP